MGWSGADEPARMPAMGGRALLLGCVASLCACGGGDEEGAVATTTGPSSLSTPMDDGDDGADDDGSDATSGGVDDGGGSSSGADGATLPMTDDGSGDETAAPSEPFMMMDPLIDGTIGMAIGGTFGPTGWTTTDRADRIIW